MLQPVRIASRHDSEGRLVFADGLLVGVLVRLSDLHEAAAGAWFLEVSFEALDYPPQLSFPTLEAASDWISRRLTQSWRPA